MKHLKQLFKFRKILKEKFAKVQQRFYCSHFMLRLNLARQTLQAVNKQFNGLYTIRKTKQKHLPWRFSMVAGRPRLHACENPRENRHPGQLRDLSWLTRPLASW